MPAGKRKRRFGISVPEELAEALDKLAEVLSADRSRLVNEALRAFLEDHKHHIVPHECTGLLIVVAMPGCSNVPSLLEEFRDVIQGYNHFHTHSFCIEVLFVSGPSARVSALHGAVLRQPGCSVRYVPLCH